MALVAVLAPPDELDAELAKLRTLLVTEVEALATEAHGRKLYLQRDRVYAGLIELEPDHAVARRALGFRRDRSGAWEQRSYREPRDRGKGGALEEFWALRAERTGGIRDRVLALLDGVGAARRERELRAWILMDPADPVLRAAVGEALGPQGRWLLTDSVRALERRAALVARAETARAAAPAPRPWTAPATVSAATALRSQLQTPVARLGGRCSEEEAARCLEAIWILQDLLDSKVLPPPPPKVLQRGNLRKVRTQQIAWRDDFTVYLLEDSADVPGLLGAFPDLAQAERDLYPKLTSGWLEGARVLGVWSPGEAARRDALARQFVGCWLRDHFGLSTRQGWAWEGFGLYLGHLAVHTRLTFFIRETDYVEQGSGPNLTERLRATDADWLAMLAEVLESERAPKLGFMLGKDVNGMDQRELLLAHGLAAWLIEARPEEAATVLLRMGKGQDPANVLEEVLGMRLPRLERHLMRWVKEVAAG